MFKKKYLPLFLILIMAIFISSCSKSEPKIDGPVEEKIELKDIEGELVDKYIEDDISYVEIKSDEIKKLKVDADLIDEFDKGSIVSAEYDEDLEIKNIKLLSKPKEPVKKEEPVEIEISSNIIMPTEKVPTEDLNIVKSFDVKDFNEYGILEVSMFTNAQKDDTGHFMWDDGNEFLILARMENEDYVLFEERVQLGQPEFYVFNEDNIFHIAILESSTAHLSFKDYTLNEQGFSENIYYETEGNVNMISY
ncbi:MAG: hypothetical protein Q4P29_06940 [Tissierellia bacterium]|nr:hypothetical protein [Tissierellia bacterium]